MWRRSGNCVLVNDANESRPCDPSAATEQTLRAQCLQKSCEAKRCALHAESLRLQIEVARREHLNKKLQESRDQTRALQLKVTEQQESLAHEQDKLHQQLQAAKNATHRFRFKRGILESMERHRLEDARKELAAAEVSAGCEGS